jgi:hypothetical protein
VNLREALLQVETIHRHVCRGEVFRGYRSMGVAFSGVLAILAAVAQAAWIPAPLEQTSAYLGLWIGVAGASAAVPGVQLWLRARAAGCGAARRLTWQAIEQMLPCLAAGAVLTCVLVRYVPEAVWMLPGLWAIVFSLGVFASSHLLPRPIFLVGCYYLACGTAVLLAGRWAEALSPWSMALCFGGGQLLTATILYITLERVEDGLAA